MASKINPIDYINSDEVIRAIKLFHSPGDVIEIRIPTQQKSRTISGYYIGSAEGHEYPDLQVGDEVNPRPFFMPL
jgi:hypothetical protein